MSHARLHEWGEKTTRDRWMEWCSSCNDIKVSRSSAEGRASILLLDLCRYLHLRLLQCGWWPERMGSQVHAVEMGFPSRAARSSLRVGLWSLDIRRRRYRWSQRGGNLPLRQTTELVYFPGLTWRVLFSKSCLRAVEIWRWVCDEQRGI